MLSYICVVKLKPKYRLLTKVLNLTPNQSPAFELNLKPEDEKQIKVELDKLFDTSGVKKHQDNILFVLFSMLDFLVYNYGYMAKGRYDASIQSKSIASMLYLLNSLQEDDKTSMRLTLSLSKERKELDKIDVTDRSTLKVLANLLNEHLTRINYDNLQFTNPNIGILRLASTEPLQGMNFKHEAAADIPIPKLLTNRQIYGIACSKLIEYLDKNTNMTRKLNMAGVKATYSNPQLIFVYNLLSIFAFTDQTSNKVLYMKSLIQDTVRYVPSKLK